MLSWIDCNQFNSTDGGKQKELHYYIEKCISCLKSRNMLKLDDWQSGKLQRKQL